MNHTRYLLILVLIKYTTPVASQNEDASLLVRTSQTIQLLVDGELKAKLSPSSQPTKIHMIPGKYLISILSDNGKLLTKDQWIEIKKGDKLFTIFDEQNSTLNIQQSEPSSNSKSVGPRMINRDASTGPYSKDPAINHIISKYFEAIGGEENLKAIKTIKLITYDEPTESLDKSSTEQAKLVGGVAYEVLISVPHKKRRSIMTLPNVPKTNIEIPPMQQEFESDIFSVDGLPLLGLLWWKVDDFQLIYSGEEENFHRLEMRASQQELKDAEVAKNMKQQFESSGLNSSKVIWKTRNFIYFRKDNFLPEKMVYIIQGTGMCDLSTTTTIFKNFKKNGKIIYPDNIQKRYTSSGCTGMENSAMIINSITKSIETGVPWEEK